MWPHNPLWAHARPVWHTTAVPSVGGPCTVRAPSGGFRAPIFRYTMALFGYVGTHVTSCELEDAAYMLADDTDSSDWDARKYLKSRPFAGAKGVLFENFVRDFGAALSSEIDEDADLEETMLGTDLGGDAYAGQANVTAASTRRRGRRLKLVYSHLYRHVIDPRLREMMHAHHKGDGRAAFLLLVTHCRERTTDLEMFALNATWAATEYCW